MTRTTAPPILLTRVTLDFGTDTGGLRRRDLSAVTLAADDSLWLGADEGNTVERLTRIGPDTYGDHCPFAVGDYVDLPDPDDEIDIEGMQCEGAWLWLGVCRTWGRKPG